MKIGVIVLGARMFSKWELFLLYTMPTVSLYGRIRFVVAIFHSVIPVHLIEMNKKNREFFFCQLWRFFKICEGETHSNLFQNKIKQLSKDTLGWAVN